MSAVRHASPNDEHIGIRLPSSLKQGVFDRADGNADRRLNPNPPLKLSDALHSVSPLGGPDLLFEVQLNRQIRVPRRHRVDNRDRRGLAPIPQTGIRPHCRQGRATNPDLRGSMLLGSAVGKPSRYPFL